MKLWFSLAAPLLLACSACGVVPLPIGPSDPTAPPPLRAQDANFRTLVAQWFGVWSTDKASIVEAEALFTPEADAHFFDGFMPLEGRFGAAGWCAAARRSARERFARFDVTPREGVWLRRLGDRAIASVPFRVALRSPGGKAGETDGRTTLVWERRDGAWRIVHEHTSFALIEEWLGGEDMTSDASADDHIHPRDAEFQALVDAYLAALAESRSSDAPKADAPARFFAPDQDVLTWNPTSRRPLLGWSGVAAHRDAVDLRIYLTRKQSRGDVRVWKNGDLAWATFTFNARATRRDGERFDVVGCQTDVFQKIDGDWRIVHEHASIPYGPDGTPGMRSEFAQSGAESHTPRGIPPSPAPSPVSAARAGTDAPNVSFDALLVDYCRAWSMKGGAFDENGIARLYSTEGLESARTYLDGEPWTVAVKMGLWTEGANALTLASEPDSKFVRRGNLAWTSNTQTIDFVPRQGPAVKGRQFQTAIWEFQNGRWVIVHEHVTLKF